MFHKPRLTAAALALSTALAGPLAAQDSDLSGTLTIFSDMSNPAPRAVMEDMAARFGEMHPDLEIDLTIIDREAYKTQIRNFLSANPPDVANWYAANRMRPYVDAGLFEDISDLWDDPEIAENLASTEGAMTLDGKQWGVPYTYYQWGIYYREDIYNEYGLSEPETWEELKANCQTLLDNDVKCFTIGTRYLWTAAGWFDYLNMRTHGYDFHMQLTNGEIPWTDDRVRETFANWRELIDMGAFVDNHQSYSWQEALPFMVNGEAAAYLMGNFAVAPMREAGLGDDQLDFYQFPAINPDVEMAEDAPTDTFHIPSGADNKEAAREFLRFVVSAENQTIINAGDALGQLPINASSSVDDDEMLQQGFEMLNENATGGLAQFFDRDAPAEMAAIAMEGFQEFMVFPDNLDPILQRLEQARQRIY
ncbi:ABC transporter substrate-binding protein [Allosediminivita pacifica]|uniref:Carbohydrate ABC transporter substrate-binding protein (CUT1 family) n=1 Tax=Allosediminivita pacifica TaxID=1267769 RepID=A0A2T6B257_9RHOB|nr:ABC transporter substrate-binding protein [Allosediminivita pacifica]PTX50151.1 carbohydrate ABC transporter substrate-binding protein (CUT1 family) [Allosediminivita pacifica]GGB01780.1 ABC transporter substrate-binding protein [Allosediminivita pacifica]